MTTADSVLSPGQQRALDAVRAWLRGRNAPQVFRLFGYAGTGKTTLAYGYALTVHKAQGSQWNRVVLLDEGDSFRHDARHHRYTGLTRAAEAITVVLP